MTIVLNIVLIVITAIWGYITRRLNKALGSALDVFSLENVNAWLDENTETHEEKIAVLRFCRDSLKKIKL